MEKQLPRLPVPTSMDDYRLMVKVGRDLAALHLHYEDIEGYGLKEVWTGVTADARDARPYQVTKMAWGKQGKDEDRSKIVINGALTLEGIPAEAHEYVVNGRSALEWIIDRYQIRTDKDSGITNDPNDWGREHGNPRYIVDLIQSVTAVSVKTVELVKKLEGVRLGGGNGAPKADAAERRPTVLEDVGEALKYRQWFPAYSLEAACGKFGHERAVEPLGWTRVNGYHGKRNENLYVVRAVGRSMEPAIKDGATCVFEFREGQLERDAIVLAEHTGVIDGDTQGEYSIKKLVEVKGRLVLRPLNLDYEDIPLDPTREYRIVGVLRPDCKAE